MIVSWVMLEHYLSLCGIMDELTCNSALGNFVELNAVACDVPEVEEG
jgi:hypothetical protein